MDPHSGQIREFGSKEQAQLEGYTISLTRAERRKLERVPSGARVAVFKQLKVDRSKAKAARKARRLQRGR
jgi:hypothetical protein